MRVFKRACAGADRYRLSLSIRPEPGNFSHGNLAAWARRRSGRLSRLGRTIMKSLKPLFIFCSLILASTVMARAEDKCESPSTTWRTRLAGKIMFATNASFWAAIPVARGKISANAHEQQSTQIASNRPSRQTRRNNIRGQRIPPKRGGHCPTDPDAAAFGGSAQAIGAAQAAAAISNGRSRSFAADQLHLRLTDHANPRPICLGS